MATEIMDEGKEKEDPVTVDPTAESTGVTPIADSVLDRLFTSPVVGRIARGVFGLVSLGSLGSAHASTIDANQTAAMDAFSGQTPGITADQLASPEQQVLTEYSVNKLSISGSRIAALVETADGKTKIGVGDLDASDNVVLKEVSPLPFYPLDIKVSKNNPNFLFAVGDRERRLGEGWSAVSRDGGQSWQANKTGGLTAYRGEITPDDNYGVIVEVDPKEENIPTYRYQDFTSGAPTQTDMVSTQPAKVIYSSSAATDAPIRLATSLMAGSLPGHYKGVGASGPRRGYWKMDFSPRQGTVTIELQHEDEGFPSAGLDAYQDQGQDWVWLGNNDTTATNDPSLPRGTIYLNNNDVKKYAVQEQLSSTDLIAFIGAFAADPKGGIGYIGSDVMISRDNRYRVGVEGFAIAAPNDIKQRVLLSKEGLPAPKSDKDSVQITSLGVAELGGKRFLVAGLTRWEWVYDPVKNIDRRKIIGGGLSVQDITGGVSGDSPWKAVDFVLNNVYSVFLPGLTKSHTGGW